MDNLIGARVILVADLPVAPVHDMRKGNEYTVVGVVEPSEYKRVGAHVFVESVATGARVGLTRHEYTLATRAGA